MVGLAISVTFFAPSTDLISPLSNAPLPENRETDQSDYLILGFAPYWNLRKLTPESLASITHFAYFNLHLDKSGDLYTKVNAREEDPSYTNYKRLLSGTIDHGDKPLIITLMPESQTALKQSISSLTTRQNTVKTIVKVVNESGASGVNIDYEPLGEIEPELRNNFTLFIRELRSELDGLDELDRLLTISTYASVATRPRIWDLRQLEPYTDYFVIMTYDYTLPGAKSAGPNSPLRGSGELFEHDIIKNISAISRLIPAQKVLLGIPFYGYEWDTLDETKYSPTDSRGSVASLERVQQMLDDKTLELIWDRNSLTPYGIASSSGKISQIYFENETSIKLKLEFVKSANLGGIAIWALGYEGQTDWLWPTINNTLR